MAPLSHDAPSSGELHPGAGLKHWQVEGSFCVTCAHAAAGEGAYCGLMKPSRAAPRRYLPGSPFNVEVPESPVETYELRDLVTHDKYGLGTVLGVEGDTALLVDFGTHRMRILIPCAKLFKL